MCAVNWYVCTCRTGSKTLSLFAIRALKGDQLMTEKSKILFLAANPQDVKYQLRLDREMKDIVNKLRNGLKRDAFEFTSEFCIQPGELQNVLMTHKPHILHFSGHGTGAQGIVLEDASGNTEMLSTNSLARMVKLLKDNLRMVVLNACHSKEQATALSETIDYTIGMNSPILDEAARIFAAYFYQALAHGRSVQDAFESGLIEVERCGIRGSEIPELLVRRGVDSTKPFLIAADEERAEATNSSRPAFPPPPPTVGISNNGPVSVNRDQVGHQVIYNSSPGSKLGD